MDTDPKRDNDQSCLDMFHRALGQQDTLAWEFIQHHYWPMMAHWFHCHPQTAIACRFESAENYIALGFERFWQATACYQQLRFNTLGAAMNYLRASLNGAILDTLRAYARPHLLPLPESGDTNEPWREDQYDQGELWETILGILTDERERRVAYLLFHCGLKPRQILHYCPQEFHDIHDIYRLRRRIIEHLMRNADLIRWRLSSEETKVNA